MEEAAGIKIRFELMAGRLDERTQRQFAAAEALAVGRGGISLVSQATGLSRVTITAGVSELKEALPLLEGKERIRRAGGGRKKAVDTDETLKSDLDRLIEPVTRGDPESPLRWSCKSVRVLADELNDGGHHNVSYRTIARILPEMGYSLQGNKKTLEGSDHPDRNEQFEYINAQTQAFMSTGQPVISVDTKKKELVGLFKNGGKELRPKGQPESVQVHDFVQEEGRAIPYGVFDIGRNEGWVTVGTDNDTSSFAVQTIRSWWHSMGKQAYPSAQKLLITADGGGSNGSRVKLWKLELQAFADEIGFAISVSHLPPGTSKWNKIEHRLFSFISQNWRGKPLTSHEVIVNLIRATKTKKGLKVRCELDKGKYPTDKKFTDQDVANVNMARCDFHGEWNYTIYPSYLA